MYAREQGGRELEFGVSGKLYRNCLIMYDRQMESEWSQTTGEAVTGPYAGDRLTPIPATHGSWGRWKAQYPDTLVLSKTKSPYGLNEYLLDHYDGYFYSNRAGLRGPAERDDRLESKALVLGVVVNGKAKAYPFEELKRSPVVNDTVGAAAVVVVAKKIVHAGLDVELDNVTDLVYSRSVDGRALTFEPAGETTGREPVLRDLETGSLWQPLRGESIAGPMLGKTLDQVPANTAFWFGWRDYFPQTALFQFEAGSLPRPPSFVEVR